MPDFSCPFLPFIDNEMYIIFWYFLILYQKGFVHGIKLIGKLSYSAAGAKLM